jgi:beta-glucanase (GH16 family)
MKRGLLFFALLPISVFAQIQVSDDFEGSGTINNWFGDDCTIDASFSNPHQTGINTSATVLKYEDTGGSFANVRFDVSQDFDLSDKQTFSFKIYVPSSSITGSQNNQVSLKLQDGSIAQPWSTQTEIVHNIGVDQWQEVSFDFKNGNFINLDPNSKDPVERDDFNRVLIQVNGENNNDQVIAYIDDFAYDGVLDTSSSFPSTRFTELIWSDEFNGTGALDDSKWFHQTQLPAGGSWFNGEIQHYTDRIENSFQENGYLNLVAKRETFTDQGVTKDFTSARLNSKFAFTYGYVEIRAQLPFGPGTWPALWMLGKNIDEDGAYWDDNFGTTAWPACGEIDIMEHWGTNQNHISSAIHTPSSFGGTVNTGGKNLTDVSNNFYTYSAEWTEDEIIFRVDGDEYYRYAPLTQDASTWPFDEEQYFIFNIAILPSILPSFTESPMLVDWIRVYGEPGPEGTDDLEEQGILIHPNPSNGTFHIQIESKSDYELYSPLGQLVQEGILGESNSRIELKGQEAGVYILKTQDASFRLVKN